MEKEKISLRSVCYNQDHDHELEVHSGAAADGCMTYHESLNTQTHIMHNAVIKPSINKNLEINPNLVSKFPSPKLSIKDQFLTYRH